MAERGFRSVYSLYLATDFSRATVERCHASHSMNNPWNTLDVDGDGPYILDEDKAELAAAEIQGARRGEEYAKSTAAARTSSLFPDPFTLSPDSGRPDRRLHAESRMQVRREAQQRDRQRWQVARDHPANARLLPSQPGTREHEYTSRKNTRSFS
jgi:hypothetical protein